MLRAPQTYLQREKPEVLYLTHERDFHRITRTVSIVQRRFALPESQNQLC